MEKKSITLLGKNLSLSSYHSDHHFSMDLECIDSLWPRANYPGELRPQAMGTGWASGVVGCAILTWFLWVLTSRIAHQPQVQSVALRALCRGKGPLAGLQ